MQIEIEFNGPAPMILDVEDGGSIINGLPREEMTASAALANQGDNDDDPTEYNAAMDGIESFILALACEGLPVEIMQSRVFGRALQTALEACGNNL